jgi:hypothetical protein
MGQVIPWPSPEKRPARPDVALDGPKGEILLFLGVRYERHDDPAPSPARGAASAGPAHSPSRTRKRRRG